MSGKVNNGKGKKVTMSVSVSMNAKEVKSRLSHVNWNALFEDLIATTAVKELEESGTEASVLCEGGIKDLAASGTALIEKTVREAIEEVQRTVLLGKILDMRLPHDDRFKRRPRVDAEAMAKTAEIVAKLNGTSPGVMLGLEDPTERSRSRNFSVSVRTCEAMAMYPGFNWSAFVGMTLDLLIGAMFHARTEQETNHLASRFAAIAAPKLAQNLLTITSAMSKVLNDEGVDALATEIEPVGAADEMGNVDGGLHGAMHNYYPDGKAGYDEVYPDGKPDTSHEPVQATTPEPPQPEEEIALGY